MTSPRPARTTALTSAAAAAGCPPRRRKCWRSGVPVTVAVLDEGGAVKLLSRMDGAPLISQPPKDAAGRRWAVPMAAADGPVRRATPR